LSEEDFAKKKRDDERRNKETENATKIEKKKAKR
jgi:hypothetical protein